MTRVLVAGLVAGLISIVAGPRFIAFLRRKELGQQIREEMPGRHSEKQGTPTAGGILIVLASTIAFLALSKYKLTGLKGTEAPKGRSWKTGWITKSTKNVGVVSTSSGPKLKDHVGHQVTLTGVKNGDNLQARSIKHVATSCS